jgi:hypothetical protein
MLHCSKHDKHRLGGLDCDESTRMLLCSMRVFCLQNTTRLHKPKATMTIV